MADAAHLATPQTRMEELDRKAITDPRRSREFATNRTVRFHVERELRVIESRLTAIMRAAYDSQSASLHEAGEFHEKDLLRLGYRLDQRITRLESRWWERLWRDFLADVSRIQKVTRRQLDAILAARKPDYPE